MTPHLTEIIVKHEVSKGRFVAEVDGLRSTADYELANLAMVMTHTFVPPQLRGRGIAEKLVRTALDYARAQSLKVVPSCSYVAAFIQRHAEYQNLVR